MKITDLKIHVVDAERAASLPGQGGWQWVFVEVFTDEGVSGWGECSNTPRGGSLLIARGVDSARDAIIGEDPADIERIWQKLYRRYTYLGPRGFPTAIISGVDIALWDLKGKALGRPVYDLLGGKFRDTVRLYANGWSSGCKTPDDYARAAKKVKRDGHEALKMDPFREMGPFHTQFVDGQISAAGEQEGYDLVAAVREAVGPEMEILIDAHGHYNVPTAVRLGNTLYEQSKIAWFEEPVPPDSFEALEQVRQRLQPRISVGERLFTRWEFVRLFEKRLTDFIMPDIVWTGGISEVKKLATLAEAYYVPISPHNYMGPGQILAGAHTMMTVPNFYRLEHSVVYIPHYNAFLEEPIRFEHGHIILNGKPGLGTNLNQDALKKYAYKGKW